MAKCIDTHIGLAAQPYVEDLSLDKCLEKRAATSYRLYAVRVLKIEVARSLMNDSITARQAVRVLKIEVARSSFAAACALKNKGDTQPKTTANFAVNYYTNITENSTH